MDFKGGSIVFIKLIEAHHSLTGTAAPAWLYLYPPLVGGLRAEEAKGAARVRGIWIDNKWKCGTHRSSSHRSSPTTIVARRKLWNIQV